MEMTSLQYKEFIKTTFDAYKCKSKWNEYRTIGIYNGDDLRGFLKPVTYLYKTIKPEYISLICKWRTENAIGFCNVFEGTEEKTVNWIDNILLPREDRILFMVHNLDNKPIGHLGFSTFDFDSKSCEIDNVVRGVKEGNEGIMTYAIKTLISWGRETLYLNDIFLRVRKDNSHAIKFYERLKFYTLYDIPLFKKESEVLTEWIELEGVKDRQPDLFHLYMKLNG